MSLKVDEKKRLKREALLDNALDLFLTKGMQETSISDIVKKAGVAKGTFYLYFKDKHDLRNILIAHEASKIFARAIGKMGLEEKELVSDNVPGSVFEDEFITLLDHIIDELVADKRMLSFISKNLSWGYFKFALTNNRLESDVDFYAIYEKMLEKYGNQVKDPEILLFMIIELVSSTIYSCILYDEPVSIDEIKPHLYAAVKSIVATHTIQ